MIAKIQVVINIKILTSVTRKILDQVGANKNFCIDVKKGSKFGFNGISVQPKCVLNKPDRALFDLNFGLVSLLCDIVTKH